VGRANDPVANTFRRVEVIIKSDGTFLAQEGGIPFSGTVSFSGDTANLKTTRVLDRPTDLVTKAITLTWQGPGRIEYVDPGGFHPDPVILEKVATAAGNQP